MAKSEKNTYKLFKKKILIYRIQKVLGLFQGFGHRFGHEVFFTQNLLTVLQM